MFCFEAEGFPSVLIFYSHNGIPERRVLFLVNAKGETKMDTYKKLKTQIDAVKKLGLIVTPAMNAQLCEAWVKENYADGKFAEAVCSKEDAVYEKKDGSVTPTIKLSFTSGNDSVVFMATAFRFWKVKEN